MKSFGMVSAAIALLSVSASAEPSLPPYCVGRIQDLGPTLEKNDHQPRGQGISDLGFLTQVLVNPDTGNWVIILTNTRGVSCVLDLGAAWSEVEQ